MEKLFPLALALFSALSCGGSTVETASTAGAGGDAGAAGGTAGTDGGTAGADGGTAGSVTGGTGGADCAALSAEFKATLTAAKKCSLDSTSPTCAYSADGSIAGCGYYERVEGSNGAEIALLDSLRNQFVMAGCPSGGCALGGWGPQAASCQPKGMGGSFGQCSPIADPVDPPACAVCKYTWFTCSKPGSESVNLQIDAQKANGCSGHMVGFGDVYEIDCGLGQVCGPSGCSPATFTDTSFAWQGVTCWGSS